MDFSRRVEALIRPTVESMGFGIVRVLVLGRFERRVQVMAERHDGRPITIDDCANISRTVSALLDVEDPIEGPYTLEVSSPGLDRPLTALRDYERYAGREARVETAFPIEGRRKFKGRLLGAEGDQVKLEVDGQQLALEFASIERAKLVVTDEVLAASEGGRKS
ncbi:MAG: ribosome maturation factor RimP [Rhodospirillales bacterium]|nr:ribosome maturation factor RimP [Rhodospirillales bacterium]